MVLHPEIRSSDDRCRRGCRTPFESYLTVVSCRSGSRDHGVITKDNVFSPARIPFPYSLLQSWGVSSKGAASFTFLSFKALKIAA